jgi:hypothetical protein
MAEYTCCSSVAFERPNENTFTFTLTTASGWANTFTFHLRRFDVWARLAPDADARPTARTLCTLADGCCWCGPAGNGQVVSHGSDPVSIQPYNYRPVQVRACVCLRAGVVSLPLDARRLATQRGHGLQCSARAFSDVDLFMHAPLSLCVVAHAPCLPSYTQEIRTYLSNSTGEFF